MSKGCEDDMAAGVWLRRLVGNLSEMASGDARRMARQPVVAVHALRVRMKKIRALLRLGAVEGEDLEEVHRQCREIMRGVSTARDEEVMRRLYGKLFDEVPAWEREAEATQWSVVRVRREVKRLAEMLAGVTFSGLNWDVVRANFEASFRRARKSFRRCEAGDGPDSFHALRKRVKVMYFQSVALRQLRGAKRRIRLAKALGKHLGREHDLAILASRLAKAEEGGRRRAEVEKKRVVSHELLLKEAGKLLRRGGP
jgi:hypothetical protein